ncbi:MAG: GNAT family N-acetyltransferase [Mobilitalea sp.]
MKNFVLKETTWNNIDQLKNEYLDYLKNTPDGFLDSAIYESIPNEIENDDREKIGFFTTGKFWNGDTLLTAFYLKSKYYRYAQQLFTKVLKEYKIDRAFVTSWDELLVSLAFEKMKELNTSFEMQAYFFSQREKDTVRPAEYSMDCIEKVDNEGYLNMNELTDSEWSDEQGKPAYEFYKLTSDGAIMGYGMIYRHFLNNAADIGNYTVKEYRRKGVGRSMIMGLSQLMEQKGIMPLVGCWYYNKESLYTLTSSGYVTPTRLFNVSFVNNTVLS